MRTLVLCLLLSAGFAHDAHARVKIGYTHIETVLVFMPEARQMEATLKAMEDDLEAALEVLRQQLDDLDSRPNGRAGPHQDARATVPRPPDPADGRTPACS